MSYSIQEKLIRVNNKTRPGIPLKGVKGLVIHWTANTGKGANNEAHFTYFNKGTVYASAHYFVDSKGILRIIPEKELAYHVGANSYKTTRFGSYPNNSTIGVEMCVNSDGNFAETYKRAVWLCADIIKRHKLDVDKDLIRHFDVTGKACPLMFTSDTAGRQYLGKTAAQAYAQFKVDVKAAVKGASPVVSKPVATTPKHIGTLTVLVQSLNVRRDASFTAPIVKTIGKKDGAYKVYTLKNGMYNLGGNQWCSAGKSYVAFKSV